MAVRGKLATYRAKRDFTRTPEPAGTPARRSASKRFVIQQHAARRLHYDFRVELDGGMLSWSVLKGPSLAPGDKREHGAGTVVAWDRATWEPEGDARAAVAQGRLTFDLHGEKLGGRWHLVRTTRRRTADPWRDLAEVDQAITAATWRALGGKP
jgi:bifunctional non-homologous end joining protein LigD